MKRIHYQDFAIAFQSRSGRLIQLTVDSPGGKCKAAFTLDIEHLRETWVEVGEAVRKGRPAGQAPEIPLTPVERVGEQLFNALFAGKVKDLWSHSQGQLHVKTLTEMTGLRIKLEMDPDTPELAQLMSLPWEFLYQSEDRKFVNLDPSTPVVRYLNVPHPVPNYLFKPPLRILVVVSKATADAGRYAPLNLNAERKRIEEAWANAPDVRVDFLPRATLADLRPKLQEQDYHVLHFMGHGDFDNSEGKGVLLFEDERGDAYPINGRDLADQLIGKTSLRLVFLNACETARMSDAPGQDPFAGAAAALVMSGIPAVVAMQYPITDRAAIVFASTFYTHLASGMPVDQATAEARLAVRGSFRQQMEWGTPVLFMRTDDGQLFDVDPAPRVEISSALAAAIRDCFGDYAPILLATLVQSQHTEAADWLDKMQSAVLRFDQTALSTLRTSLEYFSNTPAALAVARELLQEPVLQKRARLGAQGLARDYERLIFGPAHQGMRP